MHHYPFHVGDYIRATAHLDLIEDCIYRRLIDLYMETEQPIPNETQQVIRRLRLGSSGLILETILKEFFTLEADNCWHNSRCDNEINEFKRLAEVSRINGKLGGRPKKTQRVILDNPAITQQEPVGLQPIPNTQYPIKEKNIRANRADVFPEIQNRQLVDDWLAIRKLKKLAVTKTAINGFNAEVVKAGVTLEQALVKCCHEGWGGFKASWLAKQKTEEPKKAWE